MGRKNRNARRSAQTYSSFTDFQRQIREENQPVFNVEKAINSREKSTGSSRCRKADPNKDIKISVVKRSSKSAAYSMSISIGEKVANKLMGISEMWNAIRVLDEKGTTAERLYLYPEERGYFISHSSQATRWYLSIPIENSEDIRNFTKYAGSHDLNYDTANQLYYVITEI